jgi:hypothetical protein
MEKWYLSDNGKVNGPYSIDEIQSLVAKNNDLYGWNPSYSHWLPVVKIEEFKGFVSQEAATAQVSKELIDKFVNKKQELVKKITFIDSVVEKTTRAIARFEDEITEYKNLTKQFDAEIQENIIPLEKKYNSIIKQMTDLRKATLISKQEIDDVVAEFGSLVLNNTTGNNDGFAGLAQTNTITGKYSPTAPKKTVSTVDNQTKKLDTENSGSSVVPIRNVPKETAFKQEPQEDISVKEVSIDKKAIHDTPKEIQPLEVEKKTFKDKLKSVFAKEEEETVGSFSERLLKLDKENEISESVAESKEEIVFIDYETNSVEDEPKIKHRRRR